MQGKHRQSATYISIHAPRAGRDKVRRVKYDQRKNFNPRAPCGARHMPLRMPAGRLLFQSTRPVRGATGRQRVHYMLKRISIHAPRAGRDNPCRRCLGGNRNFNPRAPCGARRPIAPPWLWRCRDFNPRAPCGARLVIGHCRALAAKFQSTRPVRGATYATQDARRTAPISIHAPRAGRDLFTGHSSTSASQFQSTRPVRGATAKVYKITLHTFATKGNS